MWPPAPSSSPGAIWPASRRRYLSRSPIQLKEAGRYPDREELHVTVTRKLRPGLPPRDARADVHDLAAWRPVTVSVSLLESAWSLEERFGMSFWDASVVAAAQAAGCRHLLTEDLQDGADLDGVRIVDPFRTSVGPLE